MIFGKKCIEHKNGCFDLMTTFLFFRKIQRHVIVTVHRSYVKYPLSLADFNETSVLSTDFGKILKYNISWKSVQLEPSCSMRTVLFCCVQYSARWNWQILDFNWKSLMNNLVAPQYILFRHTLTFSSVIILSFYISVRLPAVVYDVWSNDALIGLGWMKIITGFLATGLNDVTRRRLRLWLWRCGFHFFAGVLNFTNFHLVLYCRKCLSSCKAVVRSEWMQ
jgi:hypothetical protein